MVNRWPKYRKLSRAVAVAKALTVVFCSFAIVASAHSQEQSTPASTQADARIRSPSSEESAILPSPNTQMEIGLPDAVRTSNGGLILQPHVYSGASVELANPMDPDWLSSHRPSAEFAGTGQFYFPQEESLPPPQTMLFTQPIEELPPASMHAQPLFQSLVESAPLASLKPSRKRWLECSEGGLGRERLPFSLFEIDPAQPFNNFRLRTHVANRMRLPDRAEYFWARAGGVKAPALGESAINYQEARVRMELGSNNFSTAFELPFRAVDPQLNGNHAGLGDLQLIVKTVLLDGEQWMLTQYFGSYFPTGAGSAGLGTGHFGLEPGLLFRNKFRESMAMHGELKFWFPLGADPSHGGQVLKLATGLNNVWYETDRSAWLPSLELSTFTVLNGQATDAFGNIRAIDGDAIFYLTPGIHYAVDQKGDFGLFEIGTSLALATSRERFTDSTWTCEMRWSW